MFHTNIYMHPTTTTTTHTCTIDNFGTILRSHFYSLLLKMHENKFPTDSNMALRWHFLFKNTRNGSLYVFRVGMAWKKSSRNASERETKWERMGKRREKRKKKRWQQKPQWLWYDSVEIYSWVCYSGAKQKQQLQRVNHKSNQPCTVSTHTYTNTNIHTRKPSHNSTCTA